MTSTNVDPSTGQFIDPMFAVVIAAAVAETVVVWVKGSVVPSGFSLCVVTLGYINLLLSWFGYHKSIQKRPIMGGLRFVVTVVLLPLYLLTIIMSAMHFAYTAIVYAGIFFLWSVWEYLKFIEHNEPKSFWRLQLRFLNLLVYGSAFYSYLSLRFHSSFQGVWLIDNSDAIVVTLIAFSILFLRITKSAGRGDTPAAKIAMEIRSLLFGEKAKVHNDAAKGDG